jgi:hypothetical protein
MTVSQERHKYHEIMAEFVKLVPKGSIVYDIGRSIYHDYSIVFKDHDFSTVDMDADKDPDILMNIEDLYGFCVNERPPQANAMLCNGVIEQCNDPMQMLRSCHGMLQDKGLILFGFCLLGYPIHDLDRFRFTQSGALFALGRCGFNIIRHEVVSREGKESYIYVVAQKA